MSRNMTRYFVWKETGTAVNRLIGKCRTLRKAVSLAIAKDADYIYRSRRTPSGTSVICYLEKVKVSDE